MALMLPSVIPPDSPPGEQEVFRRLRDDPGTSSWTVLHSLDIANHINQVFGEADFVIIIPGKGVVCVEVKSHSLIRCSGGDWYFGKNPCPESRGPFKQASAAMHSIRKYLIKIRPDFSRVVFWSAVILPFASGTVLTGEWHSWQLIDRSRFSSVPISWLIESVIIKAREFLLTKHNARWFINDSGIPYTEQCSEIARILRPSFEFFEGPRDKKKRLKAELKRYTEEQVVAIDRMGSNPRVIFTGPAGTGKTLIAIEAARRAFARGSKTLFVCYNSLLGSWLKEQTLPLSSLVKTGTLHSIMMEIVETKPTADQKESRDFWDNELPAASVEHLLENITSNSYLFDEIIVDEAQDIFNKNYLDFLDLILKGGLGAGKWRFFGDFEKQAIHGSGNLSLPDFMKIRGSKATEYSLRENCRNTPRVASYIKLLGGLEPDYRKILRPDDGIDPVWHYYDSMEDQQKKVAAMVSEFGKEGFHASDIVILSPISQSCASLLAFKPDWIDRLAPVERMARNLSGFCTIHAFKGMEAPVIILTDIEKLDSKKRTDIFYTGVTRALQRLSVLVSNTAKMDINRLLS